MNQVFYLLSGLIGRLFQRPLCPACNSENSAVVDRKRVHRLQECLNCHLRYRFPVEDSGQMFKFYQMAYSQKGLTTDLPDDRTLQELIQSNFQGTSKDLQRTLTFLKSTGISANSKILDFGCSWGYAVWQLCQAGYKAEGFEISRPRANFGTSKLGVTIHTDISSLPSDYDVVYSGHVLEHVPNPSETIDQMLSFLKPGGLLILFTPNGSEQRQKAQPESFHRHWGRVHPVLLTQNFVREKSTLFDRLLTTSRDEFVGDDMIHDWDNQAEDLRMGELLIIGTKKSTA